tara:strand:- start:10425 stop:11801 length:1377 start_codon:yes stop_codon:yes gene_type:complete
LDGKKKLTIQFLGAASTVTGSKYLISNGTNNLLIDCGLFQGLKSLRLKNWDEFPIDPSKIDAILLTHAHLDHSGYIPRLIKRGFRGKIFSTAATKDLCQILLTDAGYLAEEEAEYLNKHKRSKHKPALPLFTFEDAQKSIEYFQAVNFNFEFNLNDEISFQFRYAGHILGAASIILRVGDIKIGFTGDIGRPQDPIFYSPRELPAVDYLITESTYGNRKHVDSDPISELEKCIVETVARGGSVIIPSFAVGRAQSLMYYLWKLKLENKIPNIPMYLNSPMATNANAVWTQYHELHRLNGQECKDVCGIVKYIQGVEESKALNEQTTPMVIISASGMLTGGRILHHIKQFGPDEKNTILLTGFQAAGTRGEALLNGAKQIKIHGEYVDIKAKVKMLDNISAHADYSEIVEWFKRSQISPKRVFVTHGEPTAADEMRKRLNESLNWNCIVPLLNESFTLE